MPAPTSRAEGGDDGDVKGGTGERVTADDREFWSFRPLARPRVPDAVDPGEAANAVDRFLRARLDAAGLRFSPPAEPPTLVRRLFLDLVGLPPTPDDVREFVADSSPEAYARLVDRLLESPRHGERWGRHWLDVAGYADSNGHHRADTPRPLAYRYRDYVLRAVNEDKPYDRFLVEQLAGDELVNAAEVAAFTPEIADRLIATHFLRNGPDGTDSTEGNEIARTIERYAVLEQQLQITMSALYGMTIDCARCHSHKFDPIPQSDYYALQAVFYPAFNVKNWTPPKQRSIHLATPAQMANWESENRTIDRKVAEAKRDLASWVSAHRPAGTVIFRDEFDDAAATLAPRWSNTAPGDDAAAGTPGVNVDSEKPPGARVVAKELRVIESGGNSSGWLATRRKFDWTPDRAGAWIQATFRLVADRLTPAAAGAERVGYYIALHDYDGNSSVPGGNVLLDGNPAGGASVTVQYPGAKARGAGKIGTSGYKAGQSFGVRVTNVGEGKYRLEQVVDGLLEEGVVTLPAADLPDGGFGFEYCCGRSFVVDDVIVETGDAPKDAPAVAAVDAPAVAVREAFAKSLTERRGELAKTVQALETSRPAKPGEIAWVTDLSADPPDVPLLRSGRYFEPGDPVLPGLLTVLFEPGESLTVTPPASGTKTTGRRLAFARRAALPGSRSAALLARVQVNRIWMGHFGRGLVETPENFGRRGQRPSHPELLEWLAVRFIERGWSMKAIHREIVLSNAYRQGTLATPRALETDPENRLLWGYPVRRLESEAVRDAMLEAAGALDLRIGGPAIDFVRTPDGLSFVPSDHELDAGARSRRSVYVRHRRSEPVTFLQSFDQPSAEPNCLRRTSSAVVSQTLAMLNGRFAEAAATRLAGRVTHETGAAADVRALAEARVRRAWWIVYSRDPREDERPRAAAFLADQSKRYVDDGLSAETAEAAALADLCQTLLASNEFLYVR